MQQEIRIGNRTISADAPCYIIAEMSGNHNMDYGRAEKIVEAAAEAGADAIKLQTYTADTITLDSDAEPFQITQGTLWDGTTLHKLYEQAYTPWEWHEPLQKKAHDLGLDFFSSPFDFSSIDYLEKLNVPAYKIASFEITDIPLIKKAASLHKPVIISTGIALKEDIALALATCKEAGNEDVVLLKCVSAYPTPYEDIHLRSMQMIAEDFDCLIGLSDHTFGSAVAVGAVALGARIVEKHLTLARADGGVDSAFSMEPAEFKQMVKDIRAIEKALGQASYDLSEKAIREREHRRSLFIAADMQKGDVLTPENLRSVRPGDGLHTKYYEKLLGRQVTRDVSYGTPVSFDLVGAKDERDLV